VVPTAQCFGKSRRILLDNFWMELALVFKPPVGSSRRCVPAAEKCHLGRKAKKGWHSLKKEALAKRQIIVVRPPFKPLQDLA
jgi:hypothetical protein